MNPRITIDRLELDLRGIDPAVAQQAVRLLGPALQEALAAGGRPAAPRDPEDDRRVSAPAQPLALAAALAGRIAGRVDGAAQED